MTARSAHQRTLLHRLASAAVVVTLSACSASPGGPPEATNGDARSAESAAATLPAPDTPSVPRPDANTIRWTTASEVGNYGYDVYRGDTPDGPFRRLTEQPIPGAGTTDAPSRYEYVDDTIEPEREYYYYVESISAEGERARFTPVRRAPPKTAAPAVDGAAPAAGSAAEGEPEQ